MFELTMNGMTRQFETAAEMAAWRDAMQKPRPKKKKFDKQKPKSNTLTSYLKK
jgi:hypothetical protein